MDNILEVLKINIGENIYNYDKNSLKEFIFKSPDNNSENICFKIINNKLHSIKKIDKYTNGDFYTFEYNKTYLVINKYNYVNGIKNGKYFKYLYYKEKLYILKKGFLKDNIKNGIEKKWNIIKIKKNKKIKRKLKEVKYFIKGILIKKILFNKNYKTITIYKDNLKNGKEIKYKDKYIVSILNYKNNFLDGVQKYFNSLTKNLKKVINYKNGILHGLKIIYNDKYEIKELYKEGYVLYKFYKINGLLKKKYYLNNEMFLSMFFIDDILIKKVFKINDIKISCSYKNNIIINKILVDYVIDDKRIIVNTDINNILVKYHSISPDLEIYYKKKEVFIRRNNLKTFINFHNNGIVKKMINYKDNLKDGVFVKKYDNNSIEEYTKYLEGLKNGKSYNFNNNGSLISIKYFKNNILRNISYFDNNIIIKYLEFNKSKNIFKKYIYKDGKVIKYYLYNDDGSLLNKRVYQDNVIISNDIDKYKKKIIHNINDLKTDFLLNKYEKIIYLLKNNLYSYDVILKYVNSLNKSPILINLKLAKILNYYIKDKDIINQINLIFNNTEKQENVLILNIFLLKNNKITFDDFETIINKLDKDTNLIKYFYIIIKKYFENKKLIDLIIKKIDEWFKSVYIMKIWKLWFIKEFKYIIKINEIIKIKTLQDIIENNYKVIKVFFKNYINTDLSIEEFYNLMNKINF